MNRRFGVGIVFVLVLIVAVVGAGALGFNLGLAQGLAGAPVVAPATGAAPYVYGAPWLFYRPFGFGFGFLGCLFPLVGFLIFFSLLRLVFWRGGWRGGMHHRDWSQSVPPAFEDWHRRAHSGSTTDAARPSPES
jgi:hypothetical protein